MSHLINRSLRATPPVAAHAAGVYIEDSSGKRYLDACGGAAVSCSWMSFSAASNQASERNGNLSDTRAS